MTGPRYLIPALALGAVVVGLLAYHEWSAAPPQAADRPADLVVSAKDLFVAFTRDEAAADKVYNDKVVQVSGAARSISTASDGRITVLLGTGDASGGVACEFSPGVQPEYATDSILSIKGFCAGYNMDVLLQRCTVVK